MWDKKIIVALTFGILILGFSFIITSESVSINCYEEDPIKKLKIKLLYLTGNLNPFPQGVEPFSEEGGVIAKQFNDFKRECLDKW